MEFGVRRLVGATYAETPQVVSEAHLPPRRLPGVVSGVWSNRLMIWTALFPPRRDIPTATRRPPTCKEVSAGRTGHTEAVPVAYDPKKIIHHKLLEVFWRNVDPTTPDRQFCDVGSQYRTGIFCHNEGQKELAQRLKSALTHSKPFEDPIVTEITAASEFSWQRVIIRITI